MVRLDLHVHSSHSFDCRVSTAAVTRRCRQLGLGPIVLTDHDNTLGAQELLATEVPVVVGEEVTTSEGEIIGLFLTRAVPPGRSPEETAESVKAQGGLVYLQHPYDAYRRHLSEPAIERISHMIDIVEVVNGRSSERDNRRAEDLRATLGAAPGGGSDAHTIAEIGRVYVEMEDFASAAQFLRNLPQARIVTNRSPIWMAAEARLKQIRARLSGRLSRSS